MIIALDEIQNNSDNNRKSSAIELEELFQQLLVLEKNPKPSISQQPTYKEKTTATFPNKTMYNLRNLTVLPPNYHPLDTDSILQSKRNNNDSTHNNNHDIFCDRYRLSKLRRNNHSINALPIKNIVIMAILVVLLNIRLTYQELCPKTCTCDIEEAICLESYAASTPLHTLPDSTHRITLNNNNINQFTGLDYLTNLQRINLAYNKITFIDFFQVKGTVLYLNTSHNNIVELKDDVVKTILPDIVRLTSSSMYNDKNSDEQFVIQKFKELDKINVVDFILDHNYLVTIKNYTFIRWHKLQKLDLSYNSLSTLDVYSFFGLTRLESLNLRGNRFIRIPSLALLSTTLHIPSKFYPTFADQARPSSIKYLNLGENAIKQIEPDSFGMLEKAQELYLDTCLIESIEEQAFKGLHTLHLLSLDNNLLREIPTKSFKYLSLLRSLRMNSNKFTDIPVDSFINLVYLEELQLSFGFFRELQNGVFNGLDGLKRLDLSHNYNLTRIEQGAMKNLQHLNYLNLYSNNLTTLAENFYDQPEVSLEFLDLRENPLICGCNIKWLTKWLKKFNRTAQTWSRPMHNSAETESITLDLKAQHKTLINDSKYINDLVNLTCTGPPALKRKPIIDLPDNKLECLKPESKINLHIGYAALYIILTTMTIVCLLSFCRYRKDLFFLLKENLMQNNISMGLPYNKNVDELKKETQLYSSDYEHIDYNCPMGPIYNLNRDGNDQVYYNGIQQSPQNNGYL